MKRCDDSIDPGRDRPPTWREIGHRFGDERACLASFLAFEAAEILEGIKPANLVNIANRSLPCGRNLYALWKRYGTDLLAGAGLSARELRDGPRSLLLLIHEEGALASLLRDRRVNALLKRAGYQRPDRLEVLLEELEERIGGVGFPHEVGILLGYPPRDVAAFMGWSSLPFACQGPWRIYGNPVRSLELAERHRESRRRMAWRVARTDDPFACLRRAG